MCRQDVLETCFSTLIFEDGYFQAFYQEVLNSRKLLKLPWEHLLKGILVKKVFLCNWCFQTVVLEQILESSLDSKEIKPVNPIGNQSWIFTGRTDAEAPILRPPDSNSQLFRKDPDAGKDWRQEGRERQTRCLDGITDSMDMSLSKLWEIVKDRETCRAAIHGSQSDMT